MMRSEPRTVSPIPQDPWSLDMLSDMPVTVSDFAHTTVDVCNCDGWHVIMPLDWWPSKLAQHAMCDMYPHPQERSKIH